jgi:tetratricopeptide (TPR) repeat protein
MNFRTITAFAARVEMRSSICARIGCIALSALVGSQPAHAQQAPEWEFCDARGLGTPDVRIQMCTALIESGRESGRASAYNNRANARQAKGDLDRAIADYDEAIRLAPTLATTYNGRAAAWQAKGDLDRAIADYDEAIRLNPKYATAYNNRGFAWKAKGDLDRAIADYDEAIRLNPKMALGEIPL